VLEAAVEVLGVLADDDHVDTVVAALDPGQCLHRPQVRVEVELLAKLDVHRAVAGTHGGLRRPLERNLVPPHRLEDTRRERRAFLADGARAGLLGLPLERQARGRKHANSGGGDLGPDAVSGDQRDRVAHPRTSGGRGSFRSRSDKPSPLNGIRA
jgi:hypothetical protein